MILHLRLVSVCAVLNVPYQIPLKGSHCCPGGTWTYLFFWVPSVCRTQCSGWVLFKGLEGLSWFLLLLFVCFPCYGGDLHGKHVNPPYIYINIETSEEPTNNNQEDNGKTKNPPELFLCARKNSFWAHT